MKWIVGFIVLCLYVNGIPLFLPPAEIAFWVAYWAGFFLLTILLAKFLLGLKGISGFGLQRHSNWLVNLGLGLLIGMSIYAVKYAIFYGSGKFQVTGFMPAQYILEILMMGAIAMLFSSLLNDIVIRGYVFAAGTKFNFLGMFILAAGILYVLDDSWKAGFSWINVVFSAILGFTFAYTVFNTGSIWMSFGLHWGGNMMFRVMYGFDGQGVLKLQNQVEGLSYDLISLGVTALMFPIVYLVLKSRKALEGREIAEASNRFKF
ncbi:MAG TPA: CPBP family intramembrane glutamic endopeptidase [Sphingobacteriaceae bacterium]